MTKIDKMKEDEKTFLYASLPLALKKIKKKRPGMAEGIRKELLKIKEKNPPSYKLIQELHQWLTILYHHHSITKAIIDDQIIKLQKK